MHGTHPNKKRNTIENECNLANESTKKCKTDKIHRYGKLFIETLQAVIQYLKCVILTLEKRYHL